MNGSAQQPTDDDGVQPSIEESVLELMEQAKGFALPQSEPAPVRHESNSTSQHTQPYTNSVSTSNAREPHAPNVGSRPAPTGDQYAPTATAESEPSSLSQQIHKAKLRIQMLKEQEALAVLEAQIKSMKKKK